MLRTYITIPIPMVLGFFLSKNANKQERKFIMKKIFCNCTTLKVAQLAFAGKSCCTSSASLSRRRGIQSTLSHERKRSCFNVASLYTIFTFLLIAVAFVACSNEADTARVITDREGNTVTLPYSISTVATIGASNAEIIVGLGLADSIIAVDFFSSDVVGLPEGVSTDLDMLALNAEYLVSLMPDVVFITGMARAGGDDDPLAAVSTAGIAVVYLPTSSSILDIMNDISFIAYVMNAEEAGEEIVSSMEQEIRTIRDIASTIANPRTVYFEISPAPWMFSTGSGTFLHEMIEMVGAINIFGHMDDWLPVSDEVLLNLNPDVIITNTSFLPDPISEIIERPGFNVITAVQNGDVFQVDENSTSRPSQNIIQALWEIAVAVYPEYFA